MSQVEEGIDWAVHFVDGTTVRAHQHAAGAKKATPKLRLLVEVGED
jgi:hypothetical protein